MTNCIWIFHAAGAQFAGGAFSTLEQAEAWIRDNRLTGMLTEYPIDQGVYQWATGTGVFTPSKPAHSSPEFIGRFTCASQRHYHYESGIGAQ